MRPASLDQARLPAIDLRQPQEPPGTVACNCVAVNQSCLMRDKATRKALRKYRQYDARNWQRDYWHRKRQGRASSEYSADRLQDGRSLLVALGQSVDEIECHCSSFQPTATIINRPNGVGLRKLIEECLNEWILIRHFVASICALVDKSENRSFLKSVLLTRELFRFSASTLVWMFEMSMIIPPGYDG